ncbi:MAG: hypothetical protein IJ524_06105 [Bacteroidales bacterium]|nr:hypothetical protein [Bacteroidales bacterium]
MKHSVFSKLLLPALLALLATSCVNHEEISFEGVVVGTRGCSGILMDDNMGFIVKLFSPDSIGGTMTSTEGETMTNIIVLYEPPRLLYVRDTIRGTFYLDDKYSRANCSLVWDEMNVPEGVFLKVTVE